MSEISEEEDALLAKLLLNTDLVSQEQVEEVRTLQSSLREEGVNVSIVDLLLQGGDLSRSDLNSLRTLIEEKTDRGKALMPARFEHPFLTQEGLGERAKEEGVITDETLQQVRKAMRLLKEHDVSKTEGEVLVEQGVVSPGELQFDEEDEGEGFIDEIEDPGEETMETVASAGTEGQEQSGNVKRSSVVSELDRYALEELVDRGRIRRAQIPDLVQAAKELDSETSGTSPVQSVLRDQGILHPASESDVLSAAMDRRDRAQQWQYQLGDPGPIVVTVVLIVCAAGIIYAFYGSDQETSRLDQRALKKEEAGSEESTAAVQQRRRSSERQESTEEAEQPQDTQPEGPEKRLTFTANLGRLFPNQNCECRVQFDGETIGTVSGQTNEQGTLEVRALPATEQRKYAPGVYVLRCRITEGPGASLPSFPTGFLYPLEEYGPADNARFEQFINGELWDFATLAGLPSSASAIDTSRQSYARQLRSNLTAVIDQWGEVEPYLSDREPGNRRLIDAFRALYEGCQTLRERLRSVESHGAHYYPSIRKRAREGLGTLPQVIARVMIKQLKAQDMEVSQDLRVIAGNRTGGSIAAAQSIIETLTTLRDQLPGENEAPKPGQFLKPVVREELQKLAQLETVLMYLKRDEDVRRLAFEQRKEMVGYHFISLFKYAYAQIQLRSLMLNRVSQLEVFDDDTADQIESLCDRVDSHLRQVILELVETYNVDLPEDIPGPDGSVSELAEGIREDFRRAGVDLRVLEQDE